MKNRIPYTLQIGLPNETSTNVYHPIIEIYLEKVCKIEK